MRKSQYLILFACMLAACRNPNPQTGDKAGASGLQESVIRYAKGLSIEKSGGITVIKVSAPWPGSEKVYRYALVHRDESLDTSNAHTFDAVISVPVRRIVVTSTTHIPALESLGVANCLVGFPGTGYISSAQTRERIRNGKITELGSNDAMNTEITLALDPELVVGFAVDGRNRTYEVLRQSGIPVLYNGDWTEETPLGKAEWIKFFAALFGKEEEGDKLFGAIEKSYLEAKQLARNATNKPTVLCGALFKDVWYLPGGKSWAARFLEDANAAYLWADTDEVGSLSLSVEGVINRAQGADYWISPSQFTSYAEMRAANRHYQQFAAFRNQKVYTFALTTGETGGFLYYELAPNRPDLVLRDLIHILHPGLLGEYNPHFFKPLL